MDNKKAIFASLIIGAMIILLPSMVSAQLTTTNQQLTTKSTTSTTKTSTPPTSTNTTTTAIGTQMTKSTTTTSPVSTQKETTNTAISNQPTTATTTKTLNPQPEPSKTATSTSTTSTGMKELSPQPDPPGKQSTNQITTPTTTKTLNPQPEPPKTATSGQAVTTLETKTLNPQPEPPKDKSTETKAVDVKSVYSVEVKAPMPASTDKTLGIVTTTTRTTTNYDSVSIKIKDKKIVVNSKETVDSSKLTSSLKDKPIILVPLLSSIDQNYHYNVKLAAQEDKAMANFTYDDKEISLPISNDLKVENKKLYLTGDSDNYEVKILPPELYGQIHAKIEKSGAKIGQIKLQIKDKKGVYEVKLKEKFKLFGFLPMGINSTYTIESQHGEVTTQSLSWYKFLGTTPNLTLMPSVKLIKAQGQKLQFMETEYPRVIINSFTATPLTLNREYGPVRLAWSTENAHRIHINAEINNPYVPIPVIAMPVPTPATGYIDVYPNESTEYELVVANRGGQEAERVVNVNVSLPNVIVQQLEPNEPSTLRGRRGYSKMRVVFRNTGLSNFLGIINIDGITGGEHGDYYYYNPAFIANIPAGRTYTYDVYRGSRPSGMSPLENFVSGETYTFNIRYSTDKQPLTEYANDNLWIGSVLVPTY